VEFQLALSRRSIHSVRVSREWTTLTASMLLVALFDRCCGISGRNARRRYRLIMIEIDISDMMRIAVPVRLDYIQSESKASILSIMSYVFALDLTTWYGKSTVQADGELIVIFMPR
jgi:hypothetical protein